MPAILSTAAATARVPVVGARPGALVEIAPGQRVAAVAPADVPRFVVAELVPAGDGTYRLRPRVLPRLVLNNEEDLRLYGIPFSRMTIKRLITAGFIKGGTTTPSLTSFDYESYLAHIAACFEDPEFWDRVVADPVTGRRVTNRQRFSEAI